MARNHTKINSKFLTSLTISELTDTQEAILIRLLLASDDWGRLPDDPRKARRLACDYNRTEDQYAETIERLINNGMLKRYTAAGVNVLSWKNWFVYQSFRWQNESEYPNIDGFYESSTNPRSGRNGNPRNNPDTPPIPPQEEEEEEENKTKQSYTSHDTSHDTFDDTSNGQCLSERQGAKAPVLSSCLPGGKFQEQEKARGTLVANLPQALDKGKSQEKEPGKKQNGIGKIMTIWNRGYAETKGGSFDWKPKHVKFIKDKARIHGPEHLADLVLATCYIANRSKSGYNGDGGTDYVTIERNFVSPEKVLSEKNIDYVEAALVEYGDKARRWFDDLLKDDARRDAWRCLACKDRITYIKPGERPEQCLSCGGDLSQIETDEIAVYELMLKRFTEGMPVTHRCRTHHYPSYDDDGLLYCITRNAEQDHYCLACGMPLEKVGGDTDEK